MQIKEKSKSHAFPSPAPGVPTNVGSRGIAQAFSLGSFRRVWEYRPAPGSLWGLTLRLALLTWDTPSLGQDTPVSSIIFHCAGVYEGNFLRCSGTSGHTNLRECKTVSFPAPPLNSKLSLKADWPMRTRTRQALPSLGWAGWREAEPGKGLPVAWSLRAHSAQRKPGREKLGNSVEPSKSRLTD